MTTDKFLGIPYERRGCSFAGCDCWGLVCLIERELFNVELPLFTTEIAIAKGVVDYADIAAEKKASFVRVIGVPIDGDIALIKVLGKPCHTAVYIDGLLFHADIACKEGSRTVRVTDIRIASRIEGFYRAKQ